MHAACSATQPCAAARHRECPARFSSFLGARHGLKASQAQALRRRSGGCGVAPSRSAVLTKGAAAATPLASAAAQPLLRVAGRLAARVLGSGVLLNLARGARGALSGRAGPFVFAGLLAYSVAVTLYAAQANRAASAASASSSSTLEVEPLELDAPESFAEAVAASALADLPPASPSAELERKLEKMRAAAAAASLASTDGDAPAPAQPAVKKEDRVVCKVCGGSGQVAYENHMMSYDGTVCPCCLGKGTVKNKRGDLISCLLTFDP
ncbi:hypothetical protein ABPG75_001228 [Micractinium tetrahymenae]